MTQRGNCIDCGIDIKKTSTRCHSCNNCGETSPNWKGGRIKDHGYTLILKSNHPRTNSIGYVREHTLVMEKKLCRYLTKQEVVHHINGVRDDNRIENLKLFENNSKHVAFHNREGKTRKDILNEDVIKLHQIGFSLTKIGKMLRCSRETITNRLKGVGMYVKS